MTKNENLGLYDPAFEHDACGIGFVAHIKGIKAHQNVTDALTILENMEHRGACGCEINTGDGAGIMIQIPHEFFFDELLNKGIHLPDINEYGVGFIFFPAEKGMKEEQNAQKDPFIGDTRNKTEIAQTVNEKDPNIDDFYGNRNIYFVDALDKKEYEEFCAKLDAKDLAYLNSNKQFYEISFKNVGGLVMPLIIEFSFTDGTTEVRRIPAEIWRVYEEKVSKVFIFDKEVKSFRLDPFLETADTDLNNNTWPREMQATRYQLYKQEQTRKENPMQRQLRVDELQKKN